MRRKGHQRASGILAILLVIAMLLDSSSILMVLGAEPVPVESESMTPEETEAILKAEETETTSENQKAEEAETNTKIEETEKSTSAKKETETEKKTEGLLKGSIYQKEDKAREEKGLEGIRVYVFNQETYKEDDPQTKEREDAVNTILYEGTTKADGSYEIPDMQPGRYRIEYVNTDAKRDLTGYSAKLVKEDAKWQLNNTEDAGKYAYFAHVPMVEIEAATEISMVLEPVEKPEESEAASEETESAAQETETKDTETAIEESTEVSEAPDTAGDLTIEDLKNADEEVAMAAQVTTATNGKKTRQASGKGWSFDVYYINENTSTYAEKTQNFNLKYQVEFRNTVNIAKNAVEIRMPRALLTNRYGQKIYPADIAVPQGTPEDFTKMSDSSFNYYIDYETDELVFFNYEAIKDGTSGAFQILYKNLKVMDIVDETKWSLTPTITVNIEETDEEGETTTTSESESSDALTGRVNTAVNFSRVTKRPYTISGKSYAPGLYTKRQVKAYTGGTLPAKYEDNFEDYRYVVWEINVTGSATQPWEIYLKERPDGGEAIGYQTEGFTKVGSGSSETLSYTTHIVTAYPADAVPEGTKVTNNVDVIVRPMDQVDPDMEKSATASWSYVDYKWTYIGDNTYVSKGAETGSLPGWLEVYRAAKDREIRGFSFRTTGYTRGYDRTHQTTGLQIGEPLEGKSYTLTTVDDFLYAYPNNDKEKYVILDQDAYYFSSVNITQSDIGYDVWEDQTTIPETAGDLEIWAYFANSTDWELVNTVKWNSSGTMSYQFSEEEIAKGPWRVKAVHNTTNYSTMCDIGVKVQMRKDSKTLAKIIEDNPDMTELVIENISGILGEVYTDDKVTSYFHSQSTNSGNYGEPELKDRTEKMYGILLQRDNAYVKLLGEQKAAGAAKSGTVANDPKNGRVGMNYRLTAYDGYQLYGQEAVDILKEAGVESPGRNEVVFYDLLPYGVQFDPSVPIVAGRTSTLNSAPGSWDKNQVKATVNTATDIITNYKNSGRMMVIIHVTYAGVDSAMYANNKWMEGWGVSFGAYYVWKDQGLVSKVPNVAAFMPAAGDTRPLIGKADQVAFDDGVVVPESLAADCKAFGSDINGDGITDVRNVLYAKAQVYDDIAMAAKSGITKLVRADADKYGSYLPSGEVEKGKGYTYELTVTNSISSTMENIVIFDQLENGAEDGTPSWQGAFAGVDTNSLESMGISPKIYYNENRDAVLTEESKQTNPADVLTKTNGWYLAEEFPGTLADVKAIAVDISKKKDGGKFQLAMSARAKVLVHMTAPEVADETLTAYNKGVCYYEEVGLDGTIKVTVEGEPTKVYLKEPGGLEIIKAFDGEIPANEKNWSFLFTVYKRDGEEKTAYANKEYELYQLKGDEWIKKEGVFGTNAKGELYLKADEKAIFYDALGISELIVEEEENIYWKQTLKETGDETSRSLLFKNAYRAPLYVTKTLQAVPEDKEAEAAEESFTFQATVGGKVLADTEFWYVDKARTDGGIPKKLGSGRTDSEGKFTIKKGQIIALLVEGVNAAYEVKEVAGYGDNTNWICETPLVTGTLALKGSSVSIANVYKWKSLYLTKEITHQKAADVTQAFTFQIQDSEGNPVTGRNRYVVMADGADISEGQLDENGSFTSACAGKTIRIEDLEAKKTYQIVETDSGEFYQAVNGGQVTVTMPTYAASEKATITNDYLKRPLTVLKQVVYDPEDMSPEALRELETKEFTMTVQVEGAALAEHPYQILAGGVVVREGGTAADGSFAIRNGEKAVLLEAGVLGNTFTVTESPDREYPQLYPANEAPQQGTIQGEGAEVTFVNGRVEGALFLNKEYVGAGDAGTAYVDQLKTVAAKRTGAAVTMTLEITEGKETYTWPKEDTQVTLIDVINSGQVETTTWKAGADLKVNPWTMVMVSGMDAEWKYTVKEAREDQYRIEGYESKWLEIYQSNYLLKGTVKENPIATIYNEVKEITFNGAEIEKRMSKKSEEVPEGAKLVWRVERYDGTAWQPAKEISYVTFAGDQVTCDRILKTEADGRITLVKSKSGYPIVRFTEADVRLNVTTGASKGDLRMIELIEESDKDWGYLSGYGTASQKNSGDLTTPSDEAVSFINANHYVPFEIEKQMEKESKDTFTMILKRVTGVSRQPIVETGDITGTEIVGGIAYSIYDSETKQWISDGETNKKGEIVLCAGQYAEVNLPEGTMWTVTEQVQQPYSLKEMRKGGDASQLTKLGENLMLIYQAEGGPMYDGIELTQDMVRDGVTNLAGERVNLSSGDVVIPENIRYNGEPRTITSIGYRAFYNSRIRTVSIPDSVTSIGDSAFYWCEWLTEISIPDSVTTIGVRAFECCHILPELILPDSVTTIGEYAFRDCYSMTNLRISERITTISNNAFLYCSSLTEISIPDSVTTIGSYAFSNCFSLTKISIPNSVTTIGSYAFYDCENLTEISIPNSVETIGDWAFYYCYRLNEISIPSSVTRIGSGAFSECYALTEIKIDNTLNAISGAPWRAPSATVTWLQTE